MKLLHYSERPSWGVKFRRYKQPPFEHDGFKPSGLWVSVEGESDWRDWCESEGFRLYALQYQTEVVLRPGHGLLTITNGAEMEAFQAKYARPHHRVPTMMIVDWPLVAADWNGLIIAPYQWEHRLKLGFMWYYGWDCASGCIWNLRAAVHHTGDCVRVVKKETADA